ncbi:MAG: oligosaccharide flippase family protein [Thermoleophilaceae bacterium]|nr:oligosaccharide flippase family protein [Thermoleophilaceae bacterium]
MQERELAFPREELRRRTARGAIVNGVFLGGGEGIALAQGLIVTILLGPKAIGLYGIVTTTAMTIAALKRVGIDEAYVQHEGGGGEAEFQRAFTLELGIALALALVIALSAPIVALAYGDSRLLPLTLAVSYLPVAFALQSPSWIFFRRMDFLKQRLLQALIPVVTFCVTVPLAAAGVGVWSLVIGPFVGNAAGALAAIKVSPYRLGIRSDREARRRYLGFSWPIFATSLALLLVQQGQVLAFDLHSGLAAAGFITLAFTLTRYADRADQIVTTTIYPAICVVRERVATLEELFAKSNRITMLFSLPFCAGFVLFAPDLVELVLGDDWRPAAILLQGLAAAAALQQVGYNWFAFYRARGQSWPQALESAALVAGFAALAVPGLLLWGSGGFIAGRIATAALMLAVRRRYLRRLLPGVSLERLALRGAAPVAAGAAAALALRLVLWGGARTLGQAVGEAVLFLAVAAAVTWLVERPLLREAGGYLRGGALPEVAGAPASAATA